MEIAAVKSTLSNNTEEIYRLKKYNKSLIEKIKKLKSTKKIEQSNEDTKGKPLDKEEENQHLRSFNQELEEQIKKLKEEKKSQDEKFEEI